MPVGSGGIVDVPLRLPFAIGAGVTRVEAVPVGPTVSHGENLGGGGSGASDQAKGRTNPGSGDGGSVGGGGGGRGLEDELLEGRYLGGQGGCCQAGVGS